MINQRFAMQNAFLCIANFVVDNINLQYRMSDSIDRSRKLYPISLPIFYTISYPISEIRYDIIYDIIYDIAYDIGYDIISDIAY